MRWIKFRGWSKEKKGWVYGGIYIVEDKAYIVKKSSDGNIVNILVESESVGQFTGVYDITNEEIYEGDIIFDCELHTHNLVFYECEDASFRIGEVEEHGNFTEFLANSDKLGSYCEIIGNYYELNKVDYNFKKRDMTARLPSKDKFTGYLDAMRLPIYAGDVLAGDEYPICIVSKDGVDFNVHHHKGKISITDFDFTEYHVVDYYAIDSVTNIEEIFEKLKHFL